MKEQFLHYVWKNMLFYTDKLRDENGNQVEVLNPGDHNNDSGPDFFNARLRIAGTEWAGNVEIHLKASDFEAHGHHTDHAYDNVILHVVAVNDRPVRNASGRYLLTAELCFDENLLEKYNSLLNHPGNIACHDQLRTADSFFIRHYLQSLCIERLTEKTERIGSVLSSTGNDWDETFYRYLCRYFGFRINTGPFEQLASALPFRIIRKHADNRFQVESLLFGTAGMLDEGLFRDAINDDYYVSLVKEYRILAAKYSLKPVHGWLWKFSRLRPANFPTLRISQLASMLCTAGGLFSRVAVAENLPELRQSFSAKASGYWDNHYLFGKPCGRKPKAAGEEAIDILVINTVVPVLFAYGHYRSLPIMKERALRFLDETAPERNIVTNEWEAAGIAAASAFETQALIHLANCYCRYRRCLECRIGSRLISSGESL